MASQRFGLIIAGGSGTRLWPASRGNRPKQLQNLGDSGQSLLQDAFGRLSRSVPAERIHTVTSLDYSTAVLRQMQALHSTYPASNVLAEPLGRDSAPAVLWGALRLQHFDPEATVAIVWSDQLVRQEAAFDEALAKGFAAVEDGGLVIVGVPANRPVTNLGYIRMGREVSHGVFAAERFVEKPDLETATRFVSEGGYLWNPGVFVFKVATLLEEFERQAPAVLAHFHAVAAARTHADARNEWNDAELIERIYKGLPRHSIDYLVLEKSDRLWLIPAQLGWSDLGAWDELYMQARKDERGNAASGNVVMLGTRNSYIRGGKRLITTVGVEHLVVVDTDDALLICDLRKAQDVKQLVDHLKQRGLAAADTFEDTQRPWGAYTVLLDEARFKVKLLEVRPGQKMSLQMHHHRSEHWVVVQGQARLTCGEETRDYATGEYCFIPQGCKHRIENASAEALSLIEVQQGEYLGEDDIVRFEDVYGRS